MRWLLNVQTDDCINTPFAIVEITGELTKKILERMDQFDQLKAIDSSISVTKYWDRTPDWYEDTSEQELETLCGLQELPDEKTEATGAVTRDCMRVECSEMCIADGEVWWTSFVKHTDTKMPTARLTRADLPPPIDASQG